MHQNGLNELQIQMIKTLLQQEKGKVKTYMPFVDKNNGKMMYSSHGGAFIQNADESSSDGNTVGSTQVD